MTKIIIGLAAMALTACVGTATSTSASSPLSSVPASPTVMAASSAAPIEASTAPASRTPTASAGSNESTGGIICFSFGSGIPQPPASTTIDAKTIRAWGHAINKTADYGRENLALYQAVVDDAASDALETERLALEGVNDFIWLGDHYGDDLESVTRSTRIEQGLLSNALTEYQAAADKVCPSGPAE